MSWRSRAVCSHPPRRSSFAPLETAAADCSTAVARPSAALAPQALTNDKTRTVHAVATQVRRICGVAFMAAPRSDRAVLGATGSTLRKGCGPTRNRLWFGCDRQDRLAHVIETPDRGSSDVDARLGRVGPGSAGRP